MIFYYPPPGYKVYWLPGIFIWLTLNQFTSLWIIKALATHLLFSTLVFLLLSPPQWCQNDKSVLFLFFFLSSSSLFFVFFFNFYFLHLDWSYSKKKLLHGSFETTKVRHGGCLWVSITYYSCPVKANNKNWWNGLLEEFLTF